MAISVVEISKKKDYPNIFPKKTAFLSGSFLQSWEWGEFLTKNNNSIKRFSILKNNRPIGSATMAIRRLPFLKYAYCPSGPNLDYQKINSQELILVFKKLKKILEKNHCSFLRFNPPLLKSDSFELPEIEQSSGKTRQPESTTYLELRSSPEKILANMKSKTRYNINLSKRKGVVVKTGSSKKELECFLMLTEQTIERDGFNPHPKNYYRNLVSALGKNNLIRIYTAYYKGRSLASNLVLFYGPTVTYLHGASSNLNRNLMPTYLLQSKAISDAYKLGFSYYDFWGVGEKKWPGVTRFKMGFQGKLVSYKPTYDYPLNKMRYKLYKLIRKIL